MLQTLFIQRQLSTMTCNEHDKMAHINVKAIGVNIELELKDVCCENFEKRLVTKFDEFLDSNVLNLMNDLRKDK
jgi:hypothetical protein